LNYFDQNAPGLEEIKEEGGKNDIIYKIIQYENDVEFFEEKNIFDKI